MNYTYYYMFLTSKAHLKIHLDSQCAQYILSSWTIIKHTIQNFCKLIHKLILNNQQIQFWEKVIVWRKLTFCQKPILMQLHWCSSQWFRGRLIGIQCHVTGLWAFRKRKHRKHWRGNSSTATVIPTATVSMLTSVWADTGSLVAKREKKETGFP